MEELKALAQKLGATYVFEKVQERLGKKETGYTYVMSGIPYKPKNG